MYLDESGGPPILFKWRALVQDVIRNLIDVFSQAEGDGLKKTFPKHLCYNRIMEFLDPLLKEFLYQESHLEKIMKEYHMLKGMVLNNKTKKRKRSRKKRKRTWNDDKARNVVKKVKRLDGSSSSSEEGSSSSEIVVPKTPKGRRQRVFWTEEEEKTLIKGVAKYGIGNWVSIHRRYAEKFHPQRTPSDLKDKWRNLQNKKKKASVEIELDKQQQLEQHRKLEQQHMEHQRLVYEQQHHQDLMLQHQHQLEQQHRMEQHQMMEQQNKEQTITKMETDS